MVYLFCQAQGPPEKDLLNKHTNGPQRQRSNLWLTWTMKYWLVDDGILISWRVIIPIIQYIQQITRVLVTAQMLSLVWIALLSNGEKMASAARMSHPIGDDRCDWWVGDRVGWSCFFGALLSRLGASGPWPEGKLGPFCCMPSRLPKNPPSTLWVGCSYNNPGCKSLYTYVFLHGWQILMSIT